MEAPDPQETAITEVADKLLGLSPAGLSPELRDFLSSVTDRYPNTDNAVDWLQTNNNGLQGQSPVNMIRAGNIRQLNDFWEGHKRACGDLE